MHREAVLSLAAVSAAQTEFCRTHFPLASQSNTHVAMPSNEHGGFTNGSLQTYPPGIHVPPLTFFDSSPRQEIDKDTQRKHLAFLVTSVVHGIVLAGTNVEAVALSRLEKVRLTSLARDVAHENGSSDLPITVGTNPSGSTRDVADDCIA